MKICLLIIFAVCAMAQSQGQCGNNAKKTENKPVSSAQTNSVITTTTPEPIVKPSKFNRLPPGIEAATEVQGKAIKNDKGETLSYEIVTAEKRLNELKAKYSGDKLVDGKGKEIRFFEPLCRGMSAGLEEDQKAQEEKNREFAELQKKYTVIVVYCNPRTAA